MSTQDGPIQRLSRIAAFTDKDPGLLMAQFNKWRQTSDVGQVLDVDDALRACETRVSQGREMPWEIRISLKDDVPDQPFWEASQTTVEETAKASSSTQNVTRGDYIVYKKGGPVYRVAQVNDDGTLKVERVVTKKISRPEDFRIVKKGSGNDR